MARHGLPPGRAYAALEIARLCRRRPLFVVVTGYFTAHLLFLCLHLGAKRVYLALLLAAGQVLFDLPGLSGGPLDLLGGGGVDIEWQRLGVTASGNVAEGDLAVAGTLIDIGTDDRGCDGNQTAKRDYQHG